MTAYIQRTRMLETERDFWRKRFEREAEITNALLTHLAKTDAMLAGRVAEPDDLPASHGSPRM